MAAPSGSSHPRLAIIRRILTMEEVFEVTMADERDDLDADQERSAPSEHGLCAQAAIAEVECETQVSSSTEEVGPVSDSRDIPSNEPEEAEANDEKQLLVMSRAVKPADGVASCGVCKCSTNEPRVPASASETPQPPLSLSSQRLGRQHGGQASNVQNKPFAAAQPNAQNMATPELADSDSDEAVMPSDMEDSETRDSMEEEEEEEIKVVDSDDEDLSSTEGSGSSPHVAMDVTCKQPVQMQATSSASKSMLGPQDCVLPKWVIRKPNETRGMGNALKVPQASRASPGPYQPHSVTILTKEGKKMDLIVIPNMAERVNTKVDAKKYRCPIAGCKMSKVAKSRGFIEKHFNNTHCERYISWRKLYVDENGPGLVLKGQFSPSATAQIQPDSSSQEVPRDLDEEDCIEPTEEAISPIAPQSHSVRDSPSTSQQFQPAITCALTTSTKPSWTRANRPLTCSTFSSSLLTSTQAQASGSSPLQSLNSLVNNEEIRSSPEAAPVQDTLQTVTPPQCTLQQVIFASQPSIYAIAPSGILAGGQVSNSMVPQFTLAVSQPSTLMLPQQQAYYSMANPGTSQVPFMLIPQGPGIPPDFAAQLQYPQQPQYPPSPFTPQQQPQAMQFHPLVAPPQSMAGPQPLLMGSPRPSTPAAHGSSASPIQRYKCVNVLVPENATPAQVASGLQNLQSLPRVSLVPVASPRTQEPMPMPMPIAMPMQIPMPMSMPPQQGYAMISAMPTQMQDQQQPATMIVPMFSVQ